MITDFRCKYILPVASQSEIVNVISTRTDQAHVIMDNVIMTRTIYQLPNLSDSSNKNQHQWLRIRVGDIDCENNSKCTITYKKRPEKIIQRRLNWRLMIFMRPIICLNFWAFRKHRHKKRGEQSMYAFMKI